MSYQQNGNSVRLFSTVITGDGAVQVTATGKQAKLLGLVVTPSGTAGSVICRSGGSGGTVLFRIPTKASNGDPIQIILPSYILFASGLHVTTLNTDEVSILHDPAS